MFIGRSPGDMSYRSIAVSSMGLAYDYSVRDDRVGWIDFIVYGQHSRISQEALRLRFDDSAPPCRHRGHIYDMIESPYNSFKPAVAVPELLPKSVRFPRMKGQHSPYAMTQIIKILLVDDHQIFRVGLAQFIATHDDLQVSAEAGSGDDAIQLVRKQEFDVVVLDISMPDKNGIDTLHVMKRIKPDLHILVLSGHPETHYAVNTLRAGASGYVCKDASPEEFIRAIRVVARGRRYLSEAATDLVSDQLKNPSDKKLHETLSEREFQIFRKLAAGQSPTTIGDELHISIKTVSTYRSRVLEKMGLKTNADLTYYAIKNALID